MSNLSKMDNYTKQLLKEAYAELSSIDEAIKGKRLAYLRSLLTAGISTVDFEADIIRLSCRKDKIRQVMHDIMAEVKKST